jgi:predicted nucleic acid-binding protein
MNYLLDVNTLLALLWEHHEHNARTERWIKTANAIAVCPLTEIGFIRISTQPSFGATVDQSRKMLADWKAVMRPGFVPCDVDILKTLAPRSGKNTTDFYLGGLAEAHGLKLATLETDLGHRAAFTIPA